MEETFKSIKLAVCGLFFVPSAYFGAVPFPQAGNAGIHYRQLKGVAANQLARGSGNVTYIVIGMVLAMILSAVLVTVYFHFKLRKERKKRMSDERYRLLLDESEIILLDFDSNQKVIAYSESVLKLLDIPDDIENFHLNFRACIHPDDLLEYVRAVSKLYDGEQDSAVSELRLRTSFKVYEYFLFKARALEDESGKSRVCGIYININDQKLLREQIEFTLTRDKLTGVMNRGKFISECDNLLRHDTETRFALVCIDVDNLSRINNICGYDSGDLVLKQVADAVTACIRGRPNVFGRIGNDDFALFLPAWDKSEIDELFANISESISKVNVELEIRVPVRIHGGSAFTEQDDDTLSLLTKAMAAQRVAKSRGEPLVDYEQSVRLLTLDRDELSGDMLDSYKNGHFEMWYQPKVNIKTKKLVGMEALMRWNHPKKGEIPPSIFIELAEQSGFIGTLDLWAIECACAQNKSWQDAGFPAVRVSANVSQSLFRNVDLVGSIHAILQKTGLDGHYLDIELTESLAVSNPGKTIEVLNELRRIGVTVSMDDFGSGYASLGTLKTLPFDTLKIDRSLIVDVDKNETSQQIVRAIMDIAGSVGLGVVAEGAERESQIEYLGKLGCCVVQGFYFGMPAPPKAFEENFTTYR